VPADTHLIYTIVLTAVNNSENKPQQKASPSCFILQRTLETGNKFSQKG
jgi:hypothetical protein